MNLRVYCEKLTVIRSENNEIEIYLTQIDKLSLLEEITDKIPKEELIKLYDE